mmetsp:Transcript_36381/g.34404  ORF Transcript_36381/g.34404 Transcript_36381/m.34404 type:complete len:145 (+) Transcript_36381:57-491(+)
MEVSISDTLTITDKRELGVDAVFSISTAKPGNGVEQLRDDSNDTYWQSDGAAPHLINMQFLKKVAVTQICFYLDFTIDESYTGWLGDGTPSRPLRVDRSPYDSSATIKNIIHASEWKGHPYSAIENPRSQIREYSYGKYPSRLL